MLVYGATYYISELPSSEFWEKDLKEIKKRGMNTVKMLAVWEDIEPEEGKYRLDNHKQLLKLCDKLKLDVLLEIRHKNRGFPRWFIEKYPAATMVTAEGNRTWQSACYNNPIYQKLNSQFVRKVVNELKGYECLKYWDIWNEPHLNSTGDHFLDVVRMVCYCEYCQKGYQKWLPEQILKKQPSIDGWLGVDLPCFSRVFRDYRNRLYFVRKVMVDEAKRLYHVVREEDNRPIALHDVFISPLFRVMSLGNDDWELAKTVDIYGTSCGGPMCIGEDAGENFYWFDPMVLDETRSAANGKPWWLSEWHVAGRFLPLAARRDRSFEAIKKEYFEVLARGGTGLLTWAYRTYSNDFCLVDIYGKVTGTFEHMTRIAQRLKETGHWEPKTIRKPDVAIVYDPENQFKIWESMGDIGLLKDATESLYKYLYDNNYMIDFIHPLTINKAGQYQAIFLPAPFGLGEQMRTGLKKYVAEGGCLVSEGCFSYLDGYATTTQGAPAYGFDKVFGLKVIDMSPPVPSGKNGQLLFRNNTGTEFTAVYRHHYEIVEADKAKVLFANGNGAKVTINNYGRGKAVYISCLFFPPANRSRDEFYSAIAVAGEVLVKKGTGKISKSTSNYAILDAIFETIGMKRTLPVGMRRDIFGNLIIYHNNSDRKYVVKEEAACHDIFTRQKYSAKTNIPVKPEETRVLLLSGKTKI